MEKLLLDIADPRFSTDGSWTLKLAALLGEEGFSLLIADEKQQAMVLKNWQLERKGAGFEGIRADLSQIFQHEAAFKTIFFEKKCLVSNAWISLVPERLFDENRLPSYLKLLMHDEGQFLFFAEKLVAQNARLVWAAERDLIFFVQSVLPGCQISHVSQQLLGAWKRLASPHSAEIYVNVRGKNLQLAAFEKGELLLFNTFSWQNVPDFLYFVMLAYEQFRFNPEAVPLFLSGEVMADSEIYRMLYRFIFDIRFVGRPDSFVWPPDALALPGHLNFDLCA